jgi:hypothetical protein
MIRHGSSRLDCVSPVFPCLWFSEPFLSDFLVVVLRPFSRGFGWGCMHEPFVVLCLVIPLTNPWVKGHDFGVFFGLGLETFLVEILRFLLIYQVLGDQIVDMECPWGSPTIPKVLYESMERIGGSGFGFGGVDPRVAIHPERLGPDRFDWCLPPVWPMPTSYSVLYGWASWSVS